MENDFDAFWKEYPKRSGPLNKSGARMSFERKVKQGVDPKKIIAAAKVYALKRDWAPEFGFYQRQFADRQIPMAQTWLNQKRYEDYEEKSGAAVSPERAAELESRWQQRRKREGWT